MAGARSVGTPRRPAAQLFTLPPAQALAAAVSGIGIDDDTHVVVYDNVGSARATRVWWLLRWLGHDRVSVLDGGLGAWQVAGFATASGAADDEAARATAASLTPRERPELLATLPDVEQIAAGTAPGVLVNALDPATYRGEQEASPYPRRGRIPGSRNLPLFTLLDPETGRFLPAGDLRDRLQAGRSNGAESRGSGHISTPPSEVVGRCLPTSIVLGLGRLGAVRRPGRLVDVRPRPHPAPGPEAGRAAQACGRRDGAGQGAWRPATWTRHCSCSPPSRVVVARGTRPAGRLDADSAGPAGRLSDG